MFSVILSPRVEKELNRIRKTDSRLLRRVVKALERLSQDPYIAKSLVASLRGYYSFRVGDYRLIFEIDQAKSTIFVENIAQRSIAYK